MSNSGSHAGLLSLTILVVGGGIAGVSAALEAAECGCDVVLVEIGPSLGGRVSQLSRYFPKLCHPACGLEINYRRLKANRRVRVYTMAGADVIATPCPLCQTNVEMYQDAINKKFGTNHQIPVMFYSQLMAVAFGMDAKEDTALDQNTIKSKKLEDLAKT